jgi:hypothetical protein
MKLSKEIRNLLITFLSNQSIVASWGISNIQIEENSLKFTVSGMKYHGEVFVLSSMETIYNVKIGDKMFESLKLDDVINKIDDYIEHTNNYKEDVMKWLSKQY